MAKNGNGEAVKAGGVCDAHIELIEKLSSICTSLKWMLRIALLLAPLAIYEGRALVQEIAAIRGQITLTVYKVGELEKQLSAHLNESKPFLNQPTKKN